ncbi:MAG: hypothetical protein J6L77_09350 [Coprococcus sp.]|nr:hypothetical protein [Coprococcus sp.]
MARQRKQGNPILSAIIFAVIGVIFLFMGLKELISINGNLLDFNTASKSELTEGTYVEGTFTYGYGAYCENVETRYGVVKRTTGYYYLQDVCEQSPEGQAYFIGVQVSKSQSDEFDNLCYSDTPSPVTIKGKIKTQTSKIAGFMDDYIYDMYSYSYDLTADDATQLKNETLHLYIDIITPSDYLIPIVIGAVMLLIAVIIFITALKKKKRDSSYSQTYGSATYNQPGGTTYNQPGGNGYDAGTFNNNNNYNAGSFNGFTPEGTNPQNNTAYTDPFFHAGEEATVALNDPSESATVALDDTSSFNLKN